MSRIAPSIALLLGLILAPLAGCSTYGPPTVTVGDAAIVERSDEAVVVDVVLDLANPNPEPFELLTFEYEFAIEGRRVYQGRRAARATLSVRGAKRLEIPAVVRFDRWDPATDGPVEGRAWSLSGKLLYVAPGEIAELLLDTGVRRPTVRFSGRGRLPEAEGAAERRVAEPAAAEPFDDE